MPTLPELAAVCTRFGGEPRELDGESLRWLARRIESTGSVLRQLEPVVAAGLATHAAVSARNARSRWGGTLLALSAAACGVGLLMGRRKELEHPPG